VELTLHHCIPLVELDYPAGTDGRPKSSDAGDSETVAASAHSRAVDDPPGSADGYAQLEQRARRRRVDGRIEAARAALKQGHVDDAAAALDELIELDPGLPILDELTAELNQQREAAASGHRGRWIAAIAACALGLALYALLMSSPKKFGPLISHRPGGSALTVAPTLPASAAVPAAGAPTDNPIIEPALPGEVEPSSVVQPRPRRSETPVEQDRLSTTPVPQVGEQTADDGALIRQTLRRYEDAYKALNAQSAHAIQPTIDEESLARAFDGLQAQSLVFDACQIEVRGSSAMAICRGAARFVRKVGTREPRTERRVWSFTLNKHDGDWTIETARTDQ
jgi:hypothetical protein